MATEGEYRTRADQHDDRFEDPLPALLAPSLLAGLEAADDRTTHTAGYGLYLLARSHDETLPTLAARVADRLAADDGHRPARRTLASLRLVDDETVRTALLDATTRDRARRLYAVVRETAPWSPPEFLPAAGDHAEFLTAFRQVVDLDREERTGTTDDAPTDVIEADGDGESEDATDEDGETAPVTDRSGEGSGGASTERERIERLADSDLVATLSHRSGFDELQALSPPRERRYATAFRARARADDTERGVTIRLLDVADGTALRDHLEPWADLVAAEGVVTVVDWRTTHRRPASVRQRSRRPSTR